MTLGWVLSIRYIGIRYTLKLILQRKEKDAAATVYNAACIPQLPGTVEQFFVERGAEKRAKSYITRRC